jgi:hypothetical protein
VTVRVSVMCRRGVRECSGGDKAGGRSSSVGDHLNGGRILVEFGLRYSWRLIPVWGHLRVVQCQGKFPLPQFVE